MMARFHGDGTQLLNSLRETGRRGGLAAGATCEAAIEEIERLRDRLHLIATSPHADGWSKDRAKAALLPPDS